MIDKKRRKQQIFDAMTSPRRDAPASVAADPQWDQVAETVQVKLVDAIADQRFPILLHGDTGVGKTCAMAVLFRARKDLGLWCRADELFDFFASCRKTVTRKSVWVFDGGNRVPRNELDKIYRPGKKQIFTQDEFQQLLLETPCLFLDEIGSSKPSDLQYQILCKIINDRQGRPTCLTSNFNRAGLGRLYDKRLASRLSTGASIAYPGQDRRLTGASQQLAEATK